MANDVSVSPTPIQRNKFDVAVELTALEGTVFGFENHVDIEKAFAKYYSLATKLEAHRRSDNLVNFLSEDLKKHFE
ncbi:hypothetical protein ACF3OH_11975 [Chryseomicrobium aureum]|uniref:hypothetical protein n=1 Tax=Chryseomicrobium aureum TaxID=1441723 RepID=UPI00370DA01B